jgi:hypothetical protein
MVSFRTLRKIIVGHALLAGTLTSAVGCGSLTPLKPDGGGGEGGGGAGGQGGVGGTATGGSGGAGGSVSCPDAGGGACQYCPSGYLTGPGGCNSCQCKPGDGGADQLACYPLFHDCASDAECCAPNRCLSITGTRQCQQEGPATGGSVTLRLVIPTSRSFCDQTSGCSSTAHITILNAAGQAIGLSIPWCSTTCSAACAPSPCPGIACFDQGIAVKTGELPWDGTSITGSTCGNHVGCYQSGFAPSGHYVARMCATPGNLTTADGGFPSTCTATGPAECVDVPFDFPGPSPVIGTLL